MKERTLEQNKRLHQLITKLNLWPHKAELVLQYTGGRTSKSHEMAVDECGSLINDLNAQDVNGIDKKNVMRRKIIGICHDMGWTREDGKIDIELINGFLLSDKSSTKKTLNNLTEQELTKAIHQFEKLREYHLKHV